VIIVTMLLQHHDGLMTITPKHICHIYDIGF